MPVYLQAARRRLLGVSALVVGAAIAFFTKLPQRVIAS